MARTLEFILHKFGSHTGLLKTPYGFLYMLAEDHAGAAPAASKQYLAIPQAYESGAAGHGDDLKSLAAKENA